MPVYLDHAATTPILPEALAAFTDALRTVGNPSSIHSAGQHARMLLEDGRARVAASLGADPVEVVFTSGGTESINLAVKGLFWARQRDRRRPRIVVPAGEHHATVDTVDWLERHEGAVVDVVPLDAQGRVDLAALEARLAAADDVALVTFLWANNEVGTIQPVERIVALAHDAGVPVHSDAVAAYGQVPVDFAASGLDALSVSAHKIGGPVGVGALVLGRRAVVEPLIHGGGQQRQVRSGTQDAPAAAAFGVAAASPHADVRHLRDRIVAGVRRAVPTAVLMGDPDDRLPGNAHFTFPGCEGDSLLFLLDAAGVAVSTGSACQAGVPEASHVLLAMGLSEDDARGALRITLGHTSTDDDVDAFLAALPAAVARAGAAGMASREPSLGR
ncbi:MULTISPECIES: cysteine desulfurase family protein [unclassified Curtobacterium]|uniref:cysteine desulfurase family protein n=1 Tax=unclassified Curtobacterium TaxID=257496 RepID=UPI000D934CA0|nr:MULTISPECIES: cysteine desulfurase family protein [unclassified Curtobacterium]PYY37053.1 cysteine desulfurase NifS [Curtobacterium sp. MCPF17_046]WIB14387.1 cysteine desulfurase family protein [Curtobacterium sp. MCPF17_050]